MADFNIIPKQDFLLVRMEEFDKVSEGGVILPTPEEKNYKIAQVFDLGPEVDETQYSPGMRVIISTLTGLPFKKFYFIRQDAIHGILVPAEEGEDVQKA